MTAEDRANKVIDHYEAIQPYRRVLGFAITQAIEDAVEEATILRGKVVAVKKRPPLVFEPDLILEEAIAEEREACAKVAETSELLEPSGSIGPLFDMGWSSAIKHIAAAIRSRK